MSSGLPLDTLASMTVAALNKSEDYMDTAGRYLLEAQERVNAGEAGDLGWIAWYRQNIEAKTAAHVKLRHAQKYMKLVIAGPTADRQHIMGNAPSRRSVTEPEDAPSRRMSQERNDALEPSPEINHDLVQLKAIWTRASKETQDAFWAFIEG